MRMQQVTCQEPIQFKTKVQLWEPEVSREQSTRGLVLHVEETGVKISLVFGDEQVFSRFIRRLLACQSDRPKVAKKGGA